MSAEQPLAIQSAVEGIASTARAIEENIERVIVGKRDTTRLLLAAYLAGLHVLLQDLPGTGKTTLVKALARSCGASYARIQFTPDLLPSDITGISIYNSEQGTFQFKEGPVFHQLILADEINRATPKVQSALLEAMEEHQVTIDGVSHPLPEPFTVLATQNPLEHEGTYPLPEAQLDRFALCLTLGYPSPDEEATMLRRAIGASPLHALEQVTSIEHIREARRAVTMIHVSDSMQRYIVSLAHATRSHPALKVGASPRASLMLLQLAQALAGINGREYVLPDDIKLLTPYVYRHRLTLTPEAAWDGVHPDQVIREILTSTPVPVGGETR